MAETVEKAHDFGHFLSKESNTPPGVSEISVFTSPGMLPEQL